MTFMCLENVIFYVRVYAKETLNSKILNQYL